MKSDKFSQVQFHTFGKICTVYIFPSTVQNFSVHFRFFPILYIFVSSLQKFCTVQSFFCAYIFFPVPYRFFLYISDFFLYCTYLSLLYKNSVQYRFFLCVHIFSSTVQSFSVHFRFLPILYSFSAMCAKYVHYRNFSVRTRENLYFLLFCPNNRFFELVVLETKASGIHDLYKPWRP